MAPGFVPPPVSIGSAGGDPWDGTQADRVGIASRVRLAIEASRTSCLDAAGTVTVEAFDAWAVACSTSANGACDNGNVSFLNQHAPDLELASTGTLEMTFATAATCAAARAAFD
jgi:hypothetical protein